MTALQVRIALKVISLITFINPPALPTFINHQRALKLINHQIIYQRVLKLGNHPVIHQSVLPLMTTWTADATAAQVDQKLTKVHQ